MTAGNNQESGCNEVFQRNFFFPNQKNEANQLFFLKKLVNSLSYFRFYCLKFIMKKNSKTKFI